MKYVVLNIFTITKLVKCKQFQLVYIIYNLVIKYYIKIIGITIWVLMAKFLSASIKIKKNITQLIYVLNQIEIEWKG